MGGVELGDARAAWKTIASRSTRPPSWPSRPRSWPSRASAWAAADDASAGRRPCRRTPVRARSRCAASSSLTGCIPFARAADSCKGGTLPPCHPGTLDAPAGSGQRPVDQHGHPRRDLLAAARGARTSVRVAGRSWSTQAGPPSVSRSPGRARPGPARPAPIRLGCAQRRRARRDHHADQQRTSSCDRRTGRDAGPRGAPALPVEAPQRGRRVRRCEATRIRSPTCPGLGAA